MSDTNQDQTFMTRLWNTHRSAEGMFRIAEAGGGILISDMSRQPPRIWAARLEDGNLRVRTAGVPNAFSGELANSDSAEIMFSRLVSGENVAVVDLSPPEAAVFMGAVPSGESWAQLSVRRFSESIVDPVLKARLPLQKMQEAEETRFSKSGLQSLRDRLDMEAVAVLSAVEDYSWKDYSYYAISGEEGSLDASRRIVRHQAAKSYPLLAGVMATRFGIKADLDKQAKFLMERAPLKLAMDAAKLASNVDEEAAVKAKMDALVKPPALLDSLEKAFTPTANIMKIKPKSIISRAALARIGGISLPPRGLKPEYVAMCMTELPPDWFPKKGADWKEEEWIAFTDLISTVGVVLNRITGSKPDTLYEGCGGKWAELRNRIVRAFTDSRPPGGDAEIMAEIEKAIDWKTLHALPKNKVEAAAIETAQRVESMLPAGVSKDDIIDWVVRLVNPPSSRETILYSCNETEIAVSLLSNKIMLPLAATLTGDGDPMLTHDQFEYSNTLAAGMLFGGKSAVKVFETLSAFHQNGAAIQSGGSLLQHEIESMNDETKREAFLKMKAAKKQKEQEGESYSVGVDLYAKYDFPIPFDPVIIAPNGVRLCTLFNWSMFEDEGRGFQGDQFGAINNREEGTAYGYRKEARNPDGSYGLNICVGMYKSHYDSCAKGNFYISARIQGGDDAIHGAHYTRLSLNSFYNFTKDDKNQWVTRTKEHAGWMNSNPPELAKEAFEWFKKSINNGEIKHSLENVEHQVQMRVSKIDRIEDICGYHWSEYPRINAALLPWMSVMNKRTRLPIVDFAKLPEVQALADSISPGWRQKAQMRDSAWGKQSYVLMP